MTAKLGTDSWICSRRFLIWQNEKARVIDDLKESQVNDCFTVRSKLVLQDTDFWIKILGKVSRSLESGASRHVLSTGEILEGAVHPRSRASPFLGRGVDLSKAYKQVPISPGSKKLVVLAVWNSTNSDYSFFLVNSTPFGGSASVYGFNRISRSLWWLMVLGLGLIATTYFDDFPVLETQRLADMAEHHLSSLLDLLNWRHATTGPKAKPFDKTFSILGVEYDLSVFAQGIFRIRNKPGRVEKLLSIVKAAEQKGELSKPQAASLHGALYFATGFMMGRHFKPMLMNLLDLPAEQNKDVVSKSLRRLRLALEEAGDKVIQPGSPSPPGARFYQCRMGIG